MARQLYVFHYQEPQAEYSLNCGRLAQEIADRWQGPRGVADPSGFAGGDADPPGFAGGDADPPGFAGGGADPEVSDDDDDDDDAVSANLNDVELWGAVAQLQWVMSSDRAIDARAVTTLLADLTDDGELDRIRLAVRRLVAALAATYPTLARASRPALVQLVALGRDMATAAGESPDLFEFVKNELQAVNLAALLRV